MRGRVCDLLLLLVLASAVLLGSESRGTQDHILLSQFLRLPQPGGQGRRIYILQEQSQSHIMTDSQSASLSWYQAPIWDLRPIFLSP
jgi:hypothetical protein